MFACTPICCSINFPGKSIILQRCFCEIFMKNLVTQISVCDNHHRHSSLLPPTIRGVQGTSLRFSHSQLPADSQHHNLQKRPVTLVLPPTSCQLPNSLDTTVASINRSIFLHTRLAILDSSSMS
uniref:Uncharacterized protein n=1 Tax=Arundo donax TaxID=35708 RepID=A0A0A9E7Q2_ARUDO